MKEQVCFAVWEMPFERDGFHGYRYEIEGHAKGEILFYHGWSSSAERQRFRCRTLASAGYRVAVVDAPHHGANGALDYMKPEVAARYFWQTIAFHLDAFPALTAALRAEGWAGKQLFVMGHSMGGFTALGLMAAYPDIAGLVAYNAASDWDWTNAHFLDLEKDIEIAEGDWQRFRALESPWEARAKFIGRPILLTNGEADPVVPMAGNARLVEYLQAQSPASFRYLSYPEQGHFVTDGMLADGLQFLASLVDNRDHI